MIYMVHALPITAADVKRVREENPGMGLFDAKKIALQEKAQEERQNALDAVEALRWESNPFEHASVLCDVLEYLIKRK